MRREDVFSLLWRRSSQAAGLFLFVCAFLLLVLQVTYDPADPSLNHAIDGPTHNWLGPFGAAVGDFLYQIAGRAPLLLPLVFAAWSSRLLLGRGVARLWLRLLILLPALSAGSVMLAALHRGAAAGLKIGGGWLGTEMLAIIHRDLGDFGDVPVAAGSGFALLLLSLHLCGLSRHDIREIGERAGKVAAASGKRRNRAAGIGFPPTTILQPAIPVLRRRLAAGLGGLFRRGEAELAADGGARGEWAKIREGWERQEPNFGSLTRRAERGTVEMAPAPAHESPRPERRMRQAEILAPHPAGIPGARRAAGQRQTAFDPASSFPDKAGKDGPSLPQIDLLAEAPSSRGPAVSEETLQRNARQLETVLDDFGVRGQIVKVRPGPVVTLYELEPAPGIKASRIIGLADDIARSMSAVSVRVAVVPGRNVIGIELPNRQAETVYLRELLDSEAYAKAVARLPLVLGKDIGGAPVVADLAKMPHLLIAGTTGSGKSVGINTMILSILFRMTPDQCKFIMVDPKMLELSIYDGIPHLLAPVVTDPRKAVVALKWVVREMENRYRSMSKLGVRNIEGYNTRLAEARDKGETLMRRVQTGFDPETGQPIFEEQQLDADPLPMIVVVVDEMADLMLVAGKDIEGAIQRLAQMARAAGIHLIMATQRPSVDVITGTIKANFPTRISFQVTSKIDSRTILGEGGAEQLLGRGDMLYMAGGGRITRVHGPFVGDTEVEAVVNFLKSQGEPTYLEEVTRDEEAALAEPEEEGSESGDALYDQAVALVCREGKASTSFVQRHLQIGYNRAARIIERMEQEGVVSAANHVGKREVLAPGA